MGIVSGYIVKLRIVPDEEVDGRRVRRNSDNLTTVIETNATSLLVGDVDPRIIYAVSVAARTGAGIGSYSPEAVVGCKLHSLIEHCGM